MAIGHVRYSTTGSSRVGERPAGLPLRPPRGRARPQRQPHQRRRAARRAARARRRVPLHLGLGDHRRAALHPPGRAHRGRGGRRAAAPGGRLLHRRDDARRRRRLPRPARACGRCRSGASATATAWPARRCAFDIIGAELLREVAARRDRLARPRGGIETRQVVEGARQAFCVFEHIYFARPDSMLEGNRTQVSRRKMGEILWREAPVDADVVIPVPDSGNPAAAGYSQGLGHPAGRRPDQEPLRRPHVHPARPGAAQARPAAEVQPAARGRGGQAARRRRRLDRARQHHAPDRRRCCATPAPPRSTCGSPRRRSATPATTGSTCPRARRWSPTGARSRRSPPSSAATRSPTSRSRASTRRSAPPARPTATPASPATTRSSGTRPGERQVRARARAAARARLALADARRRVPRVSRPRGRAVVRVGALAAGAGGGVVRRCRRAAALIALPERLKRPKATARTNDDEEGGEDPGAAGERDDRGKHCGLLSWA